MATGKMYRGGAGKGDQARLIAEPLDADTFRTPWRRDYGRVVHCAAWRRLQGKTQLFPGVESDFFRNRLTHSLEVAQIAKAVAVRLNATDPFLKPRSRQLEPDIVEIAGLCHDLGHPPFGHNGEEALDELMRDEGGFEGNAQTFRILARLEKRKCSAGAEANGGINSDGTDGRAGLNLTSRVLASVLKYDRQIPPRRKDSDLVVKGYYECDADLVNKVKKDVGAPDGAPFKTVECQIMDLADDIAYSTYDLEDALKAGFVSPLSMMGEDLDVLETVARSASDKVGEEIDVQEVAYIIHELFAPMVPSNSADQDNRVIAAQVHRSSVELAQNGYMRTAFTSQLVGQAVNAVEFEANKEYPCLSKVRLSKEARRRTEVVKTYTFNKLIMAPKMRIVAVRGKEIVEKIFNSLANHNVDAHHLLPLDVRRIHDAVSPSSRKRVICDFVAGMTDRYAIEFYGRLTSERPETIFKPL